MTTPDELDPSGELAARIIEQQVEYGTYVANQNIYAGNALAYAPGHPVPVANVIAHGYWLNGQVDLVDGAVHAEAIRKTVVPAVPAPPGEPPAVVGSEPVVSELVSSDVVGEGQ